MWFGKKITVFKKKDKDTWQKIRNILKDEGFTGVRAGHYDAESLRPAGCCSHLDPRNFGANGYIDRDIYFVDVRPEDADRARSVIASHGLEAVVEADPIGKLGRM